MKGSSSFYEIWYFKLNIRDEQAALWLRLTTLYSLETGKHVAEVWGIYTAFNGGAVHKVAVKDTFPFAAWSVDSLSGRVTIADSYWCPQSKKTEGFVQSSLGSLKWDLSFESRSRAFSHVPMFFQKLKLNRSSVETPYPNLNFNGKIQINGRLIDVHNAAGMQGYISGSRNANRWAWAHANDENFFFEALTAELWSVGPRLTVMALEWSGERLEWNGILDALTIQSNYSHQGWQLEAKKKGYDIRINIHSQIEDYVGVHYEDTDGSRLYCHNSKVSNVEVHVFHKKQKIFEKLLEKSCAYEVVDRKQDNRVSFLI